MSNFFVETDKKTVPPDYIPVKISSMGKLSVPHVLHVRDYSMDEAMRLSLSADEMILDSLMYVLKKIIWEDIDVWQLTEKELLEIMFTVYANFWNKNLTDIAYPYDDAELNILDEEKMVALKTSKWIPRIDIPVSSIKTIPIPEKFIEPITITARGKTIQFILPRLDHVRIARDYIDEKYKYHEDKYSELQQVLRQREKATEEDRISKYKVDPDLYKEYQQYLQDRSTEFIAVKQAQMVVSVNGEKLNNLESKLAAYFGPVGFQYWKGLNKFMAKDLNYGVQEMIKVKSPITGKTVERRFQFRFDQFMPTINIQDDTEFDIRFGD